MVSNKFIYFSSKNEDARDQYPEWSPPQERVLMSLHDFLERAEFIEANGGDIAGNYSLQYLIIPANKVCCHDYRNHHKDSTAAYSFPVESSIFAERITHY